MGDMTPTGPVSDSGTVEAQANSGANTSAEAQVAALFDALAREQQILLDTVGRCSDEQLERKGVLGEWSIKNTLAHLAEWEAVVISSLPDRLATGRRPAIFDEINADEDGWNARQVAEREDKPPKEQIFDLENTRNQLVNYLRSLGDETLVKPHPWPGWNGTLSEYILAEVCDHEKEHCDAICAAVAAMGLAAGSQP